MSQMSLLVKSHFPLMSSHKGLGVHVTQHAWLTKAQSFFSCLEKGIWESTGNPTCVTDHPGCGMPLQPELWL